MQIQADLALLEHHRLQFWWTSTRWFRDRCVTSRIHQYLLFRTVLVLQSCNCSRGLLRQSGCEATIVRHVCFRLRFPDWRGCCFQRGEACDTRYQIARGFRCGWGWVCCDYDGALPSQARWQSAEEYHCCGRQRSEVKFSERAWCDSCNQFNQDKLERYLERDHGGRTGGCSNRLYRNYQCYRADDQTGRTRRACHHDWWTTAGLDCSYRCVRTIDQGSVISRLPSR